jgi:hypothetical protein
MSKEMAVQEIVFPPRTQAAPLADSLPASSQHTEGLKQEAYPVRWLRGHYALSPAAAKIVAAECGWLEAV